MKLKDGNVKAKEDFNVAEWALALASTQLLIFLRATPSLPMKMPLCASPVFVNCKPSPKKNLDSLNAVLPRE